MISICALSNAHAYGLYVEAEGVGEWMGSGAKVLGLNGEIIRTEYQSVCKAQHPETGEYLLPIQRASRVDIKRTARLRELGKIPESEVIMYKARQAYDVTTCSPKTVSIQELQDKRLLEAHERGVAQTVRELEKISGGLVIAAYQHRTSRTHDPLIHTHLVVMNMRLKEDGWKSLDAWWIYANKAALTERFEREVLSHAERLGYRTEYPHLSGIPDEVFNRFSQRSDQREESAESYKQKHNLDTLSNRQIAALVSRNRPEKVVLPREQIRADQLARLTPSERTDLIRVRDQALKNSERHQVKHCARRPGDPWMAQAGGVENLSAHQLKSAHKSYEKWPSRDRYSFSNYVHYVQKQWAENPGESQSGSKTRIRPNDHVGYEPELHHREWNYGEDPGIKVRVG